MPQDIQGLKIVFGADFSTFQSQLKVANSAMNTTQKRLKEINKALKLDPTSFGLLNEKMSALGSQAANIQMKMGALRNQIASASDAAKALAESEGNLSAKAAQALSTYNTLNHSLASVKDGMAEIAKSHKMAFDREKPLEFVAALEKAGTATDEEKEKLKALVPEYERLHSQWERASKANDTAQEALGLSKAKTDLEIYNAKLADTFAQMSRIEYLHMGEAKAAEFQKITRAVELCDAQVTALSSRGKELKEALRADPGNIDLLAAKFNNSKESVEAVNAKVKLLKSSIETLGVAEDDIKGESLLKLQQRAEKAKEDFESLNAELSKTRADIAIIQSDISKAGNSAAVDNSYGKALPSIAEMQKEVSDLTAKEKLLKEQTDKANASLRQMDDAVKAKEAASEITLLEAKMKSLTSASKTANYALSASIRDLATTFSATVTPVLSMGLSAVMNAADEVDTSFRNMTKTVNGTDAQFQQLKDDAIAFSQTHAVSASQILDIEAMGGQLGIAVEQLGDFARVASNLDIATDLDAQEVAEQLGQFNNVLQWGEGDMERYGDALVRLGNNMPTQESKISQVATQIASMGKIVGMSTPEILAWSAAIASTGQGAESSGTAIQNTMSDIESAVAEGGDSLQAFADVAGISADEFASQWNDGKASDVMKSFIKGLKGIEEDGGSATNTLAGLGITGVRQVRALEGLMNTVGNLDDALQMSGDAWYGLTDQWGNAGDAANEADKKQQGLSGSLQIMRNNAENLASVAGDQLVPIINVAGEGLKGLTDILKSTNGVLSNAVVIGGGALAVVGPIVRTVAQSKASFVTLSKAIEQNRQKMIEAAYASGQMSEKQMLNALQTNKYADAIRGATTQAEKAAKAQARMAAAASLGKAALAGLAIAGVAFAASKIAEYVQSCARQRAATVSLSESYRSLASASKDGADGIASSMGNAAASAKQAADDIIQKNLDLTASFKDQMTSVIESNAEMDVYADQLHDFGSRMSELSEGDAAAFQVALDGLNQLLGTHYELIQDESGAYQIAADGVQVEIDAIDRLMEKKREQIQLEAYNQLAIQNQKDLATSQQKLADIAGELAEAQGKLSDAGKALDENQDPRLWEYLNSEYTDAANDVAELQKAYDEAAPGVDALQQKQQELANAISIASIAADDNATATEQALASNSNWTMALAGDGIEGFRNFAKAASDAGYSVEQLSGMNSSEIAGIVQKWRDGALDAADEMNAIPEGAEDAAKGATDALNIDTKALGYSFASGYAKGIGSGSFLADAAARLMAQSALNEARKTQASASPSKKTKKLGRYFGQGYAIGIEDEYKDVLNASKGMAEYAMNPLRDASYAESLTRSASTSSRSLYSPQVQTVNSGDTMLITNLTIQAKDTDSAESLYRQLRKVAMQNRR